MDKPEGLQKEGFEDLELGGLSSGEMVYDRANSHLHDAVKDVIGDALVRIKSSNRPFIVETVEIDEELPMYCVEVNPEEDEVFLAQRENRPGLTALVRGKEPGKTKKVTVIAKKNDPSPDNVEFPQDGYTLITAFSGPQAPREPSDPWFTNDVGKETPEQKRKMQQEALEFWTTHALIQDDNESPIVEGTEESFDPKRLVELL